MRAIRKVLKSLRRTVGLGRRPTTTADAIRSVIDLVRPLAIDRPLCRVGGANDGGYVVPDDLEGIVAALSPGVGRECSFDLAIANRGIPVYMADGSVDEPPVQHPKFHFTKRFVGSDNAQGEVSLDELAAAAPVNGDLLLQMDIEGGEYEALRTASDALLDRCRIIVIEFHGLRRVASHEGLAQVRATFGRLVRHHQVVHLHLNNYLPPEPILGIAIPPYLEMTLYRRDRATFGGKPVYPSGLDAPNLPNLPVLELPADWR